MLASDALPHALKYRWQEGGMMTHERRCSTTRLADGVVLAEYAKEKYRKRGRERGASADGIGDEISSGCHDISPM